MRRIEVELTWEAHPLGADGKKTTREEVFKAVCAVTGIRGDIIRSTLRTDPVIKARFLVCYLCRRYTVGRSSLNKIGQMIGRDHTTVLNGIRRFEKGLQENDPTFVRLREAVEAHLWREKTHERAA